VNTQRAFHNLALTGFMGTGKSCVARLVAAQLHFKLVDTDELIEARSGKSITAIFVEQGEEAFRALEREVVAELASHRRTVIATGGGLGANAALLDQLKQHALVVCLWASPQAIWQRVRNQTHRPLLQMPDPQEQIRALLAAREPFYKLADVLVNTEMRSIKEVAHQVVHQFHLARRAEPHHH
jgi:shikimate kinase